MKHFIKRFSPTILTILGAVGVVATAVLSAKATPEAEMRINERLSEEPDLFPTLSPIEKAKTVWPCYIPAAITGLGSIVCIFGANGLSKKSQASIASAYMLLEQASKEYQKKTKELCGVEMHRKIKSTIVSEKPCPYKPSTETLIFYEENYGEFFERMYDEVRDAEYQLNRSLALNGFVSLADFYDLLGLDRTPESEALGWNQEMGFETGVCTWIDFTHELMEMADGLKGYVITPSYEPIYGYDEWMKNF